MEVEVESADLVGAVVVERGASYAAEFGVETAVDADVD
jgi:hypothetical protein